jgi:outer membrane lipoprotein carrier protein
MTGWLLRRGYQASLILMLSGFSAVQASNVDRMIDALATKQTFSAQFVQTTSGQAGRERVASGRLWISKPGLLRWEIQKPYPQLQVLDGRQLWLYDPDLMQVTVRPLASVQLTGIAGLLLNTTGLSRPLLFQRYRFSDLPARDGLSWVEVIPKVEEPGIIRLVVGLDPDGLMSQFEIYDGLGQVTRLQLSARTLNTQLDPALFVFKTPPGVSVLNAP